MSEFVRNGKVQTNTHAHNDHIDVFAKAIKYNNFVGLGFLEEYKVAPKNNVYSVEITTGVNTSLLGENTGAMRVGHRFVPFSRQSLIAGVDGIPKTRPDLRNETSWIKFIEQEKGMQRAASVYYCVNMNGVLPTRPGPPYAPEIAAKLKTFQSGYNPNSRLFAYRPEELNWYAPFFCNLIAKVNVTIYENGRTHAGEIVYGIKFERCRFYQIPNSASKSPEGREYFHCKRIQLAQTAEQMAANQICAQLSNRGIFHI